MCFHAQQCAEKYLKALLAKSQLPIRKTHNLVALWRMLPSEQAASFRPDDLATLRRYAVHQRYPRNSSL